MSGAADGRMPWKDLSRDIAREELAGLAYMFWARLVALGAMAVWLALTLPFERSGLYLAAIACFALLGAPPYLLARAGRGSTWVTAAFLLLDAAILSYILVVPAPFSVEGWTPQLNLRLPSFVYFGVFLAGMALSYSPILVIWAGIASVVAWSTAFLWVAGLPGSVAYTSVDMLDRGLNSEAVIRAYLDPDAVSLTTLYNQVVFLVLVTVILALTVWRSRRLVRRQVAAEAQRGALSRYFSPNIVDEIATSGDAFGEPAVQPVAVLFADMVGFTAISERLPPSALVGLLREFHSRLARVAFAHGGTVDKYLGDAIMVHFGTPRQRPDDPVRALSCAAAMLDEIARWNAARALVGDAPVEIGIGIHYGEVLVGNIGDTQRLEYTVLGDAVNVASRLERLTRETGAGLVASDALVQAARDRGSPPESLVPGLRRDRDRMVRGRHAPVAVWTLPRPGPIPAGIHEHRS
ncbi:adenylate/guanylate cyclase domain-containing protein [Marinibaculum pumilum]|uniref:Adenylate/guanylate cyclase domain-containing protein n=1 Tax=Marinibaculum pumilum TaxID=1766165 RepID=A0ABV7L2E5_9PROT